MSTLVLFVALVPLVTWALHRDIRRAVRRRALRARLEPMRRAFAGFQAAIGASLLPPMVRAAADIGRSMRQVSEAMKANPDAMTQLKAMADSLRRP